MQQLVYSVNKKDKTFFLYLPSSPQTKFATDGVSNRVPNLHGQLTLQRSV